MQNEFKIIQDGSIIMKKSHCVVPKHIISKTHIGHLIAHQGATTWTPDKERMDEWCIQRLGDAHNLLLPGRPIEERFHHATRLIDGLKRGDLLISFRTPSKHSMT